LAQKEIYYAHEKDCLLIVELIKRKNDITNRSMSCSPSFLFLSPIQIAGKENHLDVVLFSIFHGLLTPGVPKFWGLIKLKSWHDRLNTDNKNQLLAVAEENRREYDTSYITFLVVLQNVAALKKNGQKGDAAAAHIVANTGVARFCSYDPTLSPMHNLIADFLCGSKDARLLLNQIILLNRCPLFFRQ